MTNTNVNGTDSSFFNLLPSSRELNEQAVSCGHTYRRIKRGVALIAVLIMFQGSSAALTSAWADGCVDNPTYCVVSTADDSIVNESEHTLRSAITTANASGTTSSTIGFADQLFLNATSSNPVVITLGSTLEIKSNVTISAPTDQSGSNILTIQRGLSVATGDPLISINTPSPQTGMQANGADVKVQIENVTIQSRANTENPQDASGNFATPGVAIQVASTTVQTESGNTTVTPEVVLKSTNVLNAVSESGGAAVNTPGDIRVENSSLTGNMAVNTSSGTTTNGGAIKADGTVTVVGSSLSSNSASGDGGAIAANTVIVTTDSGLGNSQLNNNTAGGNGGAIASQTTVTISNGTVLETNTAGGNGGAIAATQSVSVDASALQGNEAGKIGTSATSTGGDGGAIHAASVSVNASAIINNTATRGTDVGSATGNGGAIAATGLTPESGSATTTINTSILTGNQASGSGGAISSSGDVSITTSTDPNVQVTTPVINTVITQTAISENTAGGNGGAISSAGSVTVTSTDTQTRPEPSVDESASNRTNISGNIAAGNGGAISAGVSVDVSNTSLRNNQSGAAVEGENTIATQTGGDGGAIQSSGSVTVANTVIEFNRATGGSGEGRADGQGGGIAAVGEVLVQGSVVSSNSSEGNGGGISANTVIVAPTQSRSEISNNYAEGNGGAIAATQSVQIVSTVQADPGLTTRLNQNISSSSGGAITSGGEVSVYKGELTGNIAANDGGAIQSVSSVTIQHSTLSQNVAGGVRVEIGFVPSDTGGNGGAISAADNVTVTQSVLNSNIAISGLQDYSQNGSGGAISASDVQVSDSSLAGNMSSQNGGAINAQGQVTVTRSIFGVVTIVNPDYNPLISSQPNPQYSPIAEIENPNYNPLVEVINPDFNPLIEITNPNFNTSVDPTIANPNYKVDVPQLIPNPACPIGSTIYDGEDYGQGPLYVCEFIVLNGDGTQSFSNLPSKVANPLFDDRANLPNPLYDNRNTITVLTKPDMVEDSREFLLVLERSGLPEDSNQFIHNPDNDLPEILETFLYPDIPRDERATINVGNSAMSSGGSIYAGDSVNISDSTFEGGDARDFGGAIDVNDDSESISNISNSTFIGNSASSAGAIDGNQGMLNIHNTRFEENIANDGDGGAIWHIGGLEVTDSKFILNESSENGGAITLDSGSDGAPYLQIARTAFSQNSSSNKGGAIAIVGQEVGDHVSVIISSIFEGNSATIKGGAIFGSLALLLNTFKNNESTLGSAIYTPMDTTSSEIPQELYPSFLGNLFQATQSNIGICTIESIAGYFTQFNLSTDGTCLDGNLSNSIENLDLINEKSTTFIPNVYVTELMDQVDSFDLSTNFVYAFIKSEILKDFKSLPRLREVDWTAGHLQQVFSITPEIVIPEIPNTGDVTLDVVKPKVVAPEVATPILITAIPEITDADRIKMIELLASFKKAQEELAKQAALDAEARAKMIAAAKKAKSDAFAKRAAERKARLAALAAKLAATKSRGEALKQKSSWINLMQNYSKLQSVKK